MMNSNFLTLMAVVVFAAAMIYRIGVLSRKMVGYFTLLQVIYLILIPGLMFPLIFSYMRSITYRPLNPQIIFPDGFLINMTLLATLFTYGGIAIHGVTKMLAEVIDEKKDTPAANMTYYFHQTFSHNLTFSGATLVIVSLTLLDLNHVSQTTYGITASVLKGVLLAVAVISGVYNYRPYASSRWSDLKTLFLVIWLGFMGILYGIRKVNPAITEYQLLLPAFISFSVMTSLSFILVLRKLRRGWRIYFSKKRLHRLMRAAEE